MHSHLLLTASLHAALTAARIITYSEDTHQTPFPASSSPEGPGPYNADQDASAVLSTHSDGPSVNFAGAARTYFSLCSGPEGTVQTINKTPYRTYCYNSMWGSHVGLGYHTTVESCEAAYTSSTAKPKDGWHWYPGTGACYTFINPTDQLYVYHYDYNEKVFFEPVDIQNPPDGPLCPRVIEGDWYKIGSDHYRLYCKGMAKAEPQDVKQYGKPTVNITECAKWAKDVGGKMWHWWQPSQDIAPGLYTGQRNCEAIMKVPSRLVPLRAKDSYIAGVPEGMLGVADVYNGRDIE